MPRFLPLLCGILLLVGCRTRGDQPLSYDPPGATITTDKEIEPQRKRTIGFQDTGVWVTNEFEGARLNDFYQIGDSSYVAEILPENAPVNNSAWYAFKIWAARPQGVYITLTYEDGTHRYVPKLSSDGRMWQPIDERFYAADTTNGTATFRVPVGPDTLWISAQELITSSVFEAWTDAMAVRPGVTKRVIGRSRQGRPLNLLEITNNPAATDYVLVISRQHPPEVTGTLALMPFLETVAGDSDLAQNFRRRFKVLAVPLMNPDGVDNGHWRHNTGGVDLNRDWLDFNQPEPRAVRDLFLALKEDPQNKVYFAIDFHSTQEDVFYTLSRDLPAIPDGFIDAWLGQIDEALPAYAINDEPSGLGSPVSKNWFYEAFGATSLTYEVGDEEDRAQIRAVATSGAEAMMELLLAQGTQAP